MIRDAKNDGRKAIKILRDHYLGCSKPRVIALYCELTSLKLSQGEDITEYYLRAEATAVRLRDAGEQVSDALLIAMIIKGLPDQYRSFSTYTMQQDVSTMTLSNFKVSLKTYDENEKVRAEHQQDGGDNVMHANYGTNRNVCDYCKKSGHKGYNCPTKPKKWCDNHGNNISHTTDECRSKGNRNRVS